MSANGNKRPAPRLLAGALMCTSIVASGLVVSMAPPAIAEVPAASTSVATAVEQKPQHCVKDLPSLITKCFPSFSDAMAYATDGRTSQYPLAGAKQAAADPKFAALVNSGSSVSSTSSTNATSAAASSVLIGIEYENVEYGGSDLSYRAASGCDSSKNNVNWQDRDLTDNGWDNDISSFKGFNGCSVRHWEHDDYRGTLLNACSSTNFFCSSHQNLKWAGFNDKASSLQWS